MKEWYQMLRMKCWKPLDQMQMGSDEKGRSLIENAWRKCAETKRKVYGVSLQSNLQIFWLLFLSLLRLFQ